ncbi:hypothetical protein NMY22_g15873 [Coprinellus aureogranulatus]|nr:hypothetical protein NMY22_g15873 [Coprinellus aureogranulatus]
MSTQPTLINEGISSTQAPSAVAEGAANTPSSSPKTPPKKYNPKDWVITGTSSGNLDMKFGNAVDQSFTWYTPEGMTAEEIMQIPNAKNFFRDAKQAQWYIDDKAKEKAENLAKGIDEP